jgi:hypothetical protein
MTAERPTVHLTVKWAGIPGLQPEIMVNLYGETADDLAPELSSVAALVFALQRQTTAPPEAGEEQRPSPERAPRPIRQDNDEPPRRQQPRPSAGTCPNRRCSRYGRDMDESQYGGLFCPGDDEQEANGRCRWVHDERGLRRKPTRDEINRPRAAAGGRRQEWTN